MKRRFSNRSLNNLKGIHPDLRRVIDRALQDSPLDFVVIEGLRTLERQRQLVAAGASRTMNSRHLTGHAVDLMPMTARTSSWIVRCIRQRIGRPATICQHLSPRHGGVGFFNGA
jgi:peptidoglycan LD-endopeptidase CwlK